MDHLAIREVKILTETLCIMPFRTSEHLVGAHNAGASNADWFIYHGVSSLTGMHCIDTSLEGSRP